MAHYLLNDDRRFKVNPSYSSIKALRENLPRVDYKPLAKLVGSDWQRELSVVSATALSCLETSESIADAKHAYNLIGGISRRQAYRALAIFPYHVPLSAMARTEGELKKSNSFYFGVSLFLLNREYELGIAKALRSSVYKDVESYANLSELRYLVIRSLQEELDPSDYLLFNAKPGAIWLFCEGAICLRQAQTAETSNRRCYATEKAYIDKLYDAGLGLNEFETRALDSPQDGFRNVDLYVDGLATEFANKDPDFDRMRWRPYLAAKRKWNRDKKNLQLINASRPGPKLGTKRRAQY